jgi:hypothetical protein
MVTAAEGCATVLLGGEWMEEGQMEAVIQGVSHMSRTVQRSSVDHRVE